ncbi:uncharacterized protein DEA37_0014180 [Paragonimus westermani]|uniref:Uncharacterized protein n=1 Tax=Paragonimus westermani TaxID=34504 RepID=A0A5J4NR21_9TREM|nr:uncharacterized protein DEA37_0005056 [Paragonimus westermani]KAA3677518.1 uncharacterized protein DEA37_0014180 [Paragonimus westermani]
MVVSYSPATNKLTLLDAYPILKVDELLEVVKYNTFSTPNPKGTRHQIPITESRRPPTAFKTCGRLYWFCHLPVGVTNGVDCFRRKMDHLIENNIWTDVGIMSQLTQKCCFVFFTTV